MSKPSISGRKLRLGIVGCGRVFEKHFQAVNVNKERIEIVGVCDNDDSALARAVELTGAKGYGSFGELIESSGADLITICTPSGLHPEQAIRAAQSGLHVITEKPMATRWKDALRMVKYCDNAGVKLFVVKQNRKNPTVQRLKRAIENKQFGKIYMVTSNIFWTRSQDYYDQAAWRGTWEFDGGALMNQASHFIDLLEWLVGPVDSVQAMTARLARDIQAEDTATMSVRWRSGTLGSINVTMLTYPKNLEGSITVIGEKGTVRIGGLALNEIQHWEFDTPDDNDSAPAQSSYETNSVYGNGHSLYYDNVISVLSGKNIPVTDGREGLRSLELIIAAYLSARSGAQVSLPLED